MTTSDLDKIIAGLIDMEKERLTGWKGPPGAAYNVVSEELCERGLLTRHWSLSEKGLAVRNRIKEQDDGE